MTTEATVINLPTEKEIIDKLMEGYPEECSITKVEFNVKSEAYLAALALASEFLKKDKEKNKSLYKLEENNEVEETELELVEIHNITTKWIQAKDADLEPVY